MSVKYRFKRADTEGEFERIFRLLHSVFADELGQYSSRPSARLVDKFHHKNLYLIALAGDEIVGLISLHDQPPFSVAGKLADPSILDRYGRLIEIRLLAVEPAHRNGLVMAGLMNEVYEYARAYDAIVISGHVDKARLYRRLGFRDLGPPVLSGTAEYLPMIAPAAAPAGLQSRWRQRHHAPSKA
jgi:predicted N-acetyltransferase YhbS